MDPLLDVEMIPHDIDGLHLLQVTVSAGHYTPYYYVGIRVGDESMPATAEQMVRLVLKGSNKTFDSLTQIIKQKTIPLRYWRTRSKTEPASNRHLNNVLPCKNKPSARTNPSKRLK